MFMTFQLLPRYCEPTPKCKCVEDSVRPRIFWQQAISTEKLEISLATVSHALAEIPGGESRQTAQQLE